jgi:hypothetical protein
MTTQYAEATVRRAGRALCCCPFKLELFSQMRAQSVPLPSIAGQSAWERGYTQHPLSEGRVEGELLWLIQVGLLRREVDGQGITDSFRLTPLGRQLVETWEAQSKGLPEATAKERLLNALNRWLRLPL